MDLNCSVSNIYWPSVPKSISFIILIRRKIHIFGLALLSHDGCHWWNRNYQPSRSTRVHSGIWWGLCCSIFSFLSIVWFIIVCPFGAFSFWSLHCLSINLQFWYLQTFLSNFNPEPWNKQCRRSKHSLLYSYSLLILLCLRYFHVWGWFLLHNTLCLNICIYAYPSSYHSNIYSLSWSYLQEKHDEKHRIKIMVELWNRRYMISHFQNHCLFPERAQRYFNLEATARRCSNLVSKLKICCVSAVFSWNIQMFGISENNIRTKDMRDISIFLLKINTF